MLRTPTRSSILLLSLISCLGAAGCGSAATSSSGAPPGSTSDAGSQGDAGSTTDPLLEAGVTIDKANVPLDPPTSSELAAAVAQNNAFALALYGQVAPTVSGGNLITSPLSASLALTMTYAGAQGQTATQMAQVLALGDDAGSPFDAQNALVQEMATNVAGAFTADQRSSPGTPPSQSDYVLTIVNSVWGDKTYSWASPFLDVLAASYGTGVYLEDFVGSPSVAESTINEWVSYETDDKINNLLPPNAITNDTRIVLVNAIHLKLPWAQPFQASSTMSGTFTRGDGSTVTARFMNEGLLTGYAQTADAQVVSLPLANGALSVLLVMPAGSLSSLVSSLTPATWAALTALEPAGVSLSMPKFDFTSPSFSLAAALEALGMTSAFDPTAADFEGLCASTPDGDNIYIADVLQKATMTAEETGVEAAAATAVIGVGSAAPAKQVTLTFDHPFLVAIVDASGAIVFLGQIDDPTATGSP